jgi:drug/metabolite transporter (DMT)-like permease
MIRISDENLGLLLTTLAALGFAGKTILAKLCYNHGADPVTVLAVRMAFAGPVFAGILFFNLARKRWTLDLTRRQWLWVAPMAFFGYYLSPLLDFSGLKYVDATLGRLILFLYPTLVVLASGALARRRPPPRVWLALALGYGGLGLMMAPRLGGQDFNLGCALIFSAALTFAFYLVAMERIFKTVNVPLFTSIVLCLSCLAVLVHFSLTRPLVSGLAAVPAPVLIYGAAMALFSTVLPVYAMNIGIARLGAGRASIIGMLGPVLTFGFGFFLLGERLTPVQFFGMALVILGVSRVKS